MTTVGNLLIAHPNLRKANPFHKTVIYVYEHNDNGVMGVVLNRNTEFSIQSLFRSKGHLYNNGIPTLHQGGPVNESALVLLHTDEWHSTNTATAGPGLRVSSDGLMFEKMAMGDEPVLWRLFNGMSAWAPGQLEMELKGQFPYRPENSWLTATANDSIVFEYDGEEQWEQAIELSRTQMINQFF